MVLIEPGFIRTNFLSAMVIAKRAQVPSSPYSQMIQKVAVNLSEIAKNGSSAELVAKLILEAVTSRNPNLRYLAGKDVEALVDGKKRMGETEFYNMVNAVTK